MQIQVFLFVILVSVLSILAQEIEEGVLVGTDANFDKVSFRGMLARSGVLGLYFVFIFASVHYARYFMP